MRRAPGAECDVVAESVHRSRVSWSRGAPGDIRAHTIKLAEQTLAASSAPDFGGDSKRADPEELCQLPS